MNNRVLVVDDDPSILELLSALLESEGYQVQPFDSAPAALAAALADPPEAAVIDLMMPGMNGQDLIQALRDDPRTHNLPIVICSAYYRDLRRAALELGGDNITQLRKPFLIEELLNLVDRMASDVRQQSEREATSIGGRQQFRRLAATA